MKTDDAKKYLNKYQNHKGEFRRLRKSLDELWDDIGASGISYDGMPHSTMPFSRTEADAIRLGEEAQEKRRLCLKAKLAMAEIESNIEAIDIEPIRQALWLRYVNGYKWELVGEKMGYSERHAKRLGQQGEELIQIMLFTQN